MFFKFLAKSGSERYFRNKVAYSQMYPPMKTPVNCIVVAFTVALCLPLASHASDHENTTLTLQSAIRATLDRNPTLSVFRFKDSALQGVRRTQSLAPPMMVNADIENAFGTGDYTTLESADVTLALSSVIEMGKQALARAAVVDAKYGQLATEKQVKSLDLLGDVTRRYIDVIAAQERLSLAHDAQVLATDMARSVAQRAQAGVSPEAEVLRAKAAQSQAKIVVDAAASELTRAKNALSSLWGEPQSHFLRAQGDLYALGEPGDFNTLATRLEQHPALAYLVDESRIKDAEIRLAKSQRATDVEWSAGVRRLQATQDMAFTAGISIPLGSDSRASGAVKTALAERESVDAEKQIQLHLLRTQLADAFERRKQALTTVANLKSDLLPTLEKALAETRLAYERGRYSYVEWVATKTELVAARSQYIDAAAEALRYRAEIEQLTAEPLTQIKRTAP